MFQIIKDLFKKPSSDVIAVEDLEEAQRCYLKEKAAAEYHTKMAEYYVDVISRLTRYLDRK
jgi:hypothetical protein